ncbi:sensor histidine kinase [Agromyces sp. SYSU T00194]|uniref:sensor histidine kinase n=1 Tax=Agromyces chitinivorans TaxID=3158560 RepID=UPI003391E378
MAAAESPLARLSPRQRTAVTRAQIETVSARAVGLFGLVFAAQTAPVALDQNAALHVGAGTVLMAVLYGGIASLAIASITKIAVRRVSLLFALAYAAAVLAWPLLVADPAAMQGQVPWIYYLCTVATTAACITLPLWGAVTYTVVVPVVYGVVRVGPAGGSPGALIAVLDAVYAIILGLVVLIIITMLRQASGAVDAAQEAALRRYDIAVRQHANEVERVRIDALVHDSVLTTLLTAAAAESGQERARAARMARDAVARLEEAGAPGVPSAVERVELTVLVRRLRAAVSTFANPFQVRVVHASGVHLPVEAVEAIYSAAVQGMVNSIQHADGDDGRPIRRSLRVRGVGRDGVVVEIEDDGIGFERSHVPSGRLGIRMSIEERVASAGGSARVASWPGEGTRVVIAWPAELDETEALS